MFGKELIIKIKNDKINYQNEMHSNKTEDNWNSFLDKWFHVKQWPKKIIKFDEELRTRKNRIKDGITWAPIYIEFDIEPELYFLYHLVLVQRQKKLWPERFDRLVKNSDAKECSYCLIMGENAEMETCPFCGRPLFYAQMPSDYF